MFRAAVWPCRCASTQCSTRIRSPVCGSGQRAPGALRGVDDRAAVGERAEGVYVRAIGARHVQADGLRAGREQQRVVLERLAAVHLELLVLRVDSRGAAADDVDLVLGEEVV